MASIPDGVYSETKTQAIGTMGTSRIQTIVDYYRCTQIDDQIVSIQMLDLYGDPIPLTEKVPVAEFLKRFTYEPDKFQTKQTASTLSIDRAIASAENHVKRKEFHSAEFEYSKALKLDEENVRAKFGLGKLYTLTNELEKAENIFKSLAAQSNVLAPENKHIFNELGIELRNLKLYEQAIAFYNKALHLAPDDENLCFNIARASFENSDKVGALEYVKMALAINPNMELAQKFKKVLGG